MKKILFSLILLTVSITMTGQVPAFPGAEGHGRYVTGGRGGEIRHVTNLNDSGTGSLRAAVNGSTKKIVVFDVGGIIELKSDLTIGANTTIAGQTAPAPGITLRYRTVRPTSNNIIRFIRFRRGEEKDVNDGADATWQKEVDGVILDHCSFSWSIDEIASFYDNTHFTMQWCTLGEALANPGHTKGEHSYGGIWGGKGASFHHNFLCHMQNRVPRFCGARYNWDGYDKTKYSSSIEAEIVDFRNCVMYNWGDGNGCYGGTGGGNINIVNNYYKAGPATVNKTRVTQVSVATSSNASGTPFLGYCCRYYINGNYVTAAGSSAANYDWKGVKYDDGTYTINNEKYCADANHYYGTNATYVKNSSNVDCVKIKLDSPVDAGEVTTHTAENAFTKVLAYAGASLNRDKVDARYMKEAKNGTTTYTGSATQAGDGSAITHWPGIIDFVRDQGTYELESTARASNFDTDKDGMPDEWELLNGLDPNSAADGKTITLDTEKGWYTNLEVYLSSLVEDIMKGGNEDAQSCVNEYYPACVKMPEPTPTTNCSILWKFDTGAEGQQATLNGLAQNGIKSATVTLGSELKYNGKLTAGGLAETKIQQTKVNDTPTDANAITFSITPAKGYSLKPTSVMFTATRNGTNNGKIDAKWVDSNGTSVICTGVTPKRNNTPSGLEDQSPFYSTYSTDLDGDATTGECKLVINLYNLSFNGSSGITLKDYGFCNITIEGVMTAPEIIKGDVNGDGKVDMSDVTDLVQYILGNPSEDFNTDAADVNGDGEIGMPDVMFIIQYTINGKFPTE